MIHDLTPVLGLQPVYRTEALSLGQSSPSGGLYWERAPVLLQREMQPFARTAARKESAGYYSELMVTPENGTPAWPTDPDDGQSLA